MRCKRTIRSRLVSEAGRWIEKKRKKHTPTISLGSPYPSLSPPPHPCQSATRAQQLSSRFQNLLAARDQVIHQLVDKEDLLKKELQNKSRSEERLIEEKEGLLKVCVGGC